jgi:YVTN family beta-propeller protein
MLSHTSLIWNVEKINSTKTNGVCMKKCLFSFLLIIFFQMAHASPFLYVCNYGADNVALIDLGVDAVIGLVDNAGFDITNPVDVRHNIQGTKAYLLADFNDVMFVIDTSLNMIVSQVDSSVFPFSAPNFVRFTYDGTKAYVTNESGNNVTIIDAVTDTIVGYVNDPDGTFDLPIAIAFSPDGTQAYIANYNGDSISVVDTASDTVVSTIDTSAFPIVQPTYISFVNNTTAYVTSLNSAQVGIIDVVNQVITGYVDSGPSDFILPFTVRGTSDGVKAVVVDVGVSQALAWPASTNIVNNVVMGLSSPRFFVFSPDETTMYVSDIGTNSVYIIDLPSNSITGMIDDSLFPFDLPFALSYSQQS